MLIKLNSDLKIQSHTMYMHSTGLYSSKAMLLWLASSLNFCPALFTVLSDTWKIKNEPHHLLCVWTKRSCCNALIQNSTVYRSERFGLLYQSKIKKSLVFLQMMVIWNRCHTAFKSFPLLIKCRISLPFFHKTTFKNEIFCSIVLFSCKVKKRAVEKSQSL